MHSNLLLPKQFFDIPHLACLVYCKNFQQRFLCTTSYIHRSRCYDCTCFSKTVYREGARPVATSPKVQGLWPLLLLETSTLSDLWPLVRDLWPLLLVGMRALEPSPKMVSLWLVLQTTQPNSHRLDKHFLYEAVFLALPERECEHKPLSFARLCSALCSKYIRRRFYTGKQARPWPPLFLSRHRHSD